MPTPIHKLRMEDQLWKAADRLGASMERSASWVIRTALEEYLERQRTAKRAERESEASGASYTVVLEKQAAAMIEVVSHSSKKSPQELIRIAIDRFLDRHWVKKKIDL
jgi:predicted transcriptional regulator